MDELGFYYIRCNTNSRLKWKVFLQFVFQECDIVEFAISRSVYSDYDIPIQQRLNAHPYKDSFIDYRNANEQFFREYNWEILFFKFKFNAQIKDDFGNAKDMLDYSFDEVICFAFFKGKECLAYNIVVENTLCVKLTEEQRNYFIDKGIKFVKPFASKTPKQQERASKRHQKKMAAMYKEHPDLDEYPE